MGVLVQGNVEGAQDAVTKGIADSHLKADAAAKTLSDQLDALQNALAGITSIPSVSTTMPALVNQVDAFVTPGNLPVHPTDIDFNKPALPAITPVTPNFPALSFYSSTLLTDLKIILDNMVNNLRSTGLTPAIEQQIWDRGRERTAVVMKNRVDEVKQQFSRANWAMPIGEEVRLTFEAMDKQTDEDLAESRNIAVAQADLEQKNLQFSIQQAAQLEGILGNMSVAIQTMLVEEEKTRVLTLVELNKQNVEVFKTVVDADVAFAQGKIGIYTADTQAWSTKVQAETSRINAQVAVQAAEITYDTAAAGIAIESIKANVATMLAQKEMSLSTIKTVAQLLAQQVAGYFSSVNYSAGISGSMSYSASDSYSVSQTYPHKET